MTLAEGAGAMDAASVAAENATLAELMDDDPPASVGVPSSVSLTKICFKCVF